MIVFLRTLVDWVTRSKVVWFVGSLGLAVVIGAAGLYTAAVGYLSPRTAQDLGIFPFLVVPQALLWVSTYLLAGPLFETSPGRRVVLSTLVYLLIGIATVPLVSVPPVLIPLWPLGVFFAEFAETVYTPDEVLAAWGWGVAGLVALALSVPILRRLRIAHAI